MRKVPIAFVSMLVALLVPDVVHAQWLNYPSAGIPRTPDGKPNLRAAAPKLADGRPDFSGVWRWNPGRFSSDVTLDLEPAEAQPWAASLMEDRQESGATDDPANMRCLPHGPTRGDSDCGGNRAVPGIFSRLGISPDKGKRLAFGEFRAVTFAAERSDDCTLSASGVCVNSFPGPLSALSRGQ